MSVPVLFALFGGVILAGFLANLLFRLTRIPSVLLLVALGVLLGPMSGWVRSDALIGIAPFFGATALLVILFEGGLELEALHVLRHAPRAAVLALTVFGLSFVGVAAVAHLAAGFSSVAALMLGAILAATSPAICLPVVSGLSVRSDVKTVIKLEAVIGEVLLIVSVVLLIQSYETGAAGPAAWLWGFSRSLLVALVVAGIAGVLWSRLVGWMGREPLAYMLTLGIVCLLYFAVEELGGSAAIAVLLFGLILGNMQSIAARIGPRLRELFGVNVREEQFVLGQFMVSITAELSFLVRTFFFVYIGLLLDFSAFSGPVAVSALAMFALLLVSRALGLQAFKRGARGFTPAELRTIMALQPRGLATAVVALLPMQAGVPGAEIFPLYAFLTIILSNVYMTGGVLFAERGLRREASAVPGGAIEGGAAGEAFAASVLGLRDAGALALEPLEPEPPPAASARAFSPAVAPAPAHRLFSPAADFAGEPPPATFTDAMARLFGLRLADRETQYGEMIRASYFREPVFWVQVLLGAAICALGLILDQSAIIVGAALIVPLVRPVVATGLALASGDIYLLAKLLIKLLAAGVLSALVAAGLVGLLPFSATAEIAARTRPTLLDFLVALFGGMSGAALISVRNRGFHYLPGAVIGITLLPALCIVGFGLTGNLGAESLRGGALLLTANLFAAVLGASLVVTLVGMPRAAQAESVLRWKEQELARPLVQAVAGGLKLQHVIGRTGSLRARLIVVAAFLLLVLIPLQSALNQLSGEFRARQAVTRAQAAFEIPGRSAVLTSSFALRPGQVNVRVQVATNQLFGAEDIARFEQRVGDQLGLASRLDLVQTLSDVGQGDTIRSLLLAPRVNPPEARRPASVAETLEEGRAQVERVLGELPLPPSMQLVAARGSLGGAGRPALQLVYLAETPLGPDAAGMLTRLAAQWTGLEADQVTLRWAPARVAVALGRTGSVDRKDAERLRAHAAVVADLPEVVLALEVPPGLSAAAVEAARREVARHLAIPDARLAVEKAAAGSGRSVNVLLRPLTPGA